MNPVLEKATHLIPDKLYLRLKFLHRMGRWLNLKNPQTFNEKLQWLKLHDRNPIYSTMVDKYEAKKYVASIIGEEYKEYGKEKHCNHCTEIAWRRS